MWFPERGGYVEFCLLFRKDHYNSPRTIISPDGEVIFTDVCNFSDALVDMIKDAWWVVCMQAGADFSDSFGAVGLSRYGAIGSSV